MPTTPAPVRVTVTVVPASAVPLKTSEPPPTLLIEGAAGATVSTVTVKGSDSGVWPPFSSVATAVKVCAPSASATPV